MLWRSSITLDKRRLYLYGVEYLSFKSLLAWQGKIGHMSPIDFSITDLPVQAEKDVYNLYCDESCHLENDKQKAMVLGTLIVPQGKHLQMSNELKELKKNTAYITRAKLSGEPSLQQNLIFI